MKFYTTSTSNINTSSFNVTSSGNVGIGCNPLPSKLTIYSNGSVGMSNLAPDHTLHIYSQYNEELEERFFNLAVCLSRDSFIDPEKLRSIYKNLMDLGSEDKDLINSFNIIDDILRSIKCPRDLSRRVIDTFIFCASNKIKVFREIDYLQMFEKIDA